MKFHLIGVNHKTAPVEVRERLAIPDSRLPEAIRRLAAHPGVEEGLILSTCNRVEVLVQTTNGTVDLRGFLRDYFQLNPTDYESHLYEFHEGDAVRHLFRVTSSLDSMVVGEPQILGQVKEAYATARAVGAVHSQLDLLLTRAFSVAKRVRTETAVGSSAVSVASVAVELAKKIFGSLQGKHVYLVGAGKMSELAARHLLAHGAESIFVANRTFDRAQQLAARFDGKAILFEQLYETCDRADIVITSTGAPHAIFRREHGEMFLARRKNRPMFFIDIAVPRDVDPGMNKLDGIFVYDIDDLQQAVSSHVADAGRKRNTPRKLSWPKWSVFRRGCRRWMSFPPSSRCRTTWKLFARRRLTGYAAASGTLSPEQELAVETLTRGIVSKIMHTPISTLKTAVREPEATTVIDLVRRLFNLQEKDLQEKKGKKKQRRKKGSEAGKSAAGDSGAES